MRNSQARFVEWKNQFCVIKFETAQPGGGSLDLRSLLRSRKPITPSKPTIRGKVPDEAHHCMHHCESHNEIKPAVILVAAAHADVIQMQPFELIYQQDGKKCRYFPDAPLAWGNELWAVEVKDDRKANDPRVIARYEVIKNLRATHGIHFYFWKKSDTCSELRLSMARSILRYQKCPISPLQRDRIRTMFAAQPVVEIGGLDDDDMQFASSHFESFLAIHAISMKVRPRSASRFIHGRVRLFGMTKAQLISTLGGNTQILKNVRRATKDDSVEPTVFTLEREC
jgi:hypothetical protein